MTSYVAQKADYANIISDMQYEMLLYGAYPTPLALLGGRFNNSIRLWSKSIKLVCGFQVKTVGITAIKLCFTALHSSVFGKVREMSEGLKVVMRLIYFIAFIKIYLI